MGFSSSFQIKYPNHKFLGSTRSVNPNLGRWGTGEFNLKYILESTLRQGIPLFQHWTEAPLKCGMQPSPAYSIPELLLSKKYMLTFMELTV